MSAPATNDQLPYIGRFAPSPTGPLHAGSLITALASYLDAHANGGSWYVRMEDLDPPREEPGAAKDILATLEHLGLHWDGEVLFQSQRTAAYRDTLEQLTSRNLSFPCDCSRQEIQAAGGVYPGRCRNRSIEKDKPHAVRCRVSDDSIGFDDLYQGRQLQHLETATGDFVILRKDGRFAYQLAVVVDDAFQKISHVIRGIDLMDSTPRQIYLQGLLGFTTPAYGHIPVIVNDLGQKLSKQHFARPIGSTPPGLALYTGLCYLNQNPDPELQHSSCGDILSWAVSHWQPGRLWEIAELREAPGLANGVEGNT